MRLRLAAELRRLREERGLTGDSVARALGWSASKVSRIEAAKTGVTPADVGRLLRHYRVRGAERKVLLSLAGDAARRGWWDELGDTVSDGHRQLIGMEHEAVTIASWHVDVVPWLLQTGAYARCVISGRDRVEPVAPAQVDRLVRVTLRRQQVLDRDRLRASIVLDESVLLRRIGTAAVMREQLQQLAEECDRDNLALRVLPLDARHVVACESFTLLGFEADGPAQQDAAWTGQAHGGFTLEGERETRLRRALFDALTEAALPPQESRRRIVEAGAGWASELTAAAQPT